MAFTKQTQKNQTDTRITKQFFGGKLMKDFDDILLGMYIGVGILTTGLMVAARKCLNSSNSTIDVEKKKVIITLDAEHIPESAFDIFIELKDKKQYLRINGVHNDVQTHTIRRISKSFVLKEIYLDEGRSVSWKVTEDNMLVIEIPVREINKKMKVKSA